MQQLCNVVAHEMALMKKESHSQKGVLGVFPDRKPLAQHGQDPVIGAGYYLGVEQIEPGQTMVDRESAPIENGQVFGRLAFGFIEETVLRTADGWIAEEAAQKRNAGALRRHQMGYLLGDRESTGREVVWL